MSSVIHRKIVTYLAGGTISKGQAVKLSSGAVVVCSAATDRAIGLAQCDAASGEPCEVAYIGGGAYGKAAGSISAGNLLGFDGSGELVKVANASDIVIAQAMEDAVDNDIFSVLVIGPFQATAAQA